MPVDRGWRIRKVEASDRADLVACIVDLQEAERRIDPRLRPGAEMADAYLTNLEHRCRAWAGQILVGDLADIVIGFAAVFTRVPFEELDEPSGEYALVSDLVVRGQYRSRGYGRRLLAAARDAARHAGATELRVSVLHGNHSAMRLYERAGFTPYLMTLRRRLRPP